MDKDQASALDQFEEAYNHNVLEWRIKSPEMFASVVDDDGELLYCDCGDAKADEETAKFIVMAHEMAPGLIAAVRLLEKIRDEGLKVPRAVTQTWIDQSVIPKITDLLAQIEQSAPVADTPKHKP